MWNYRGFRFRGDIETSGADVRGGSMKWESIRSSGLPIIKNLEKKLLAYLMIWR